jgi:Fur family transcriptional regulator, zinc uptake regulator
MEVRDKPSPVFGAALVAEAEAHCARNGLNFTRSRRRVLEVLAGQSGALGAYTIMERLAGEGVSAKPAIVYRALDFLIACGFAHRIESLNAFVACAFPHCAHLPVFLICTECGSVTEVPLLQPATLFGEHTSMGGFRAVHVIAEAKGRCAHCTTAGTTS